MVNSISILGSSSGRNAGDAALLSGIMDTCDKACGRRLIYEIPTYRPEFVWYSYQNKVRPISMLPWHGTVGMLGLPTYQSLLRSDMTIIYDAMLFDRNLYNPLTNYMSSAWLMLPAAKRKKKILGLFNAGTGPVNTPNGKKMLREIGDMVDFITVRDEDSLQLLRDLGVKNENTLVTADAALNVKPSSPARIQEIMQNLGLVNEPEILAVNVNTYLNSWTGLEQKQLSRSEFADIYASALDQIVTKLKVPLLFVCTQHHDVEITNEVIKRLKVSGKRAMLTNVDHSHYDIRGVFERVSLLFAMRLHANILCSAGLTPVAALAFQKKVISYYNLLGIGEHIMSFQDFSAEKVVNHVLKAWDEKAATKIKLTKRIPELQREAYRAAELVALIASGTAPKDAVKAIREQQARELGGDGVGARQVNG